MSIVDQRLRTAEVCNKIFNCVYNFVLCNLTEGISKEHNTSDNSDTENTISFSTSHEDIYGTHKRTRYALKVDFN